MVIVQKYGGTSLADGVLVRGAARRAVALARQGDHVVLVVSAQGHTTDILLEKALAIHPHGSMREMDACLAAGEQVSAALMAMAIENQGCAAVSLTGYQAGIHTDACHGNASVLNVDLRRIRQELEAGKIVVVAGFQGIGPQGDVTTLGRGGSDTTAVALAAALQADKCQIFTDVDGIYDKDPRRFSDAMRYDTIGYAPMLTLIAGGAQVLHDRCVQIAREHSVVLEVLSAFKDAPGTLVGDLE